MQEYAKNMQNMQKYAEAPQVCPLCIDMQKYVKNMQKNMQVIVPNNRQLTFKFQK